MNKTFVVRTSSGEATVSDEVEEALTGHPERFGVCGRYLNGCHFIRVFDDPNDPARSLAHLQGTKTGWEWVNTRSER